jgi:small subunit ribosomal protein S20
MANHKSALKKARQDEERRLRNRGHRSRLRSALKRMRASIDEGNLEAARSLLPATVSLIDRTAAKGVIHDNAAARFKSRIYQALETLES